MSGQSSSLRAVLYALSANFGIFLAKAVAALRRMKARRAETLAPSTEAPAHASSGPAPAKAARKTARKTAPAPAAPPSGEQLAALASSPTKPYLIGS